MRIPAGAAALVVAATLLAGCGGASSVDATSVSGASTAASAPLRVTSEQDGATVTLSVGQEAIIDVSTDPGLDLFVTASDEAVLDVAQAEGEGAVTASPSVTARASGTSVVTVQVVDDGIDAEPPTVLSFTVQVP